MLAAFVLGGCRGCHSSSRTISDVPDAGDAGTTTTIAMPAAGEPARADAGGFEPPVAPGPAPDAGARLSVVRALAGEREAGVFWVPVKGDFPFDDLLLSPDGRFVTHLHDRPGAAGTFRVDGTTLVLQGFMGGGPFEVRDIAVTAKELRGVADGKPLVMRKKP